MKILSSALMIAACAVLGLAIGFAWRGKFPSHNSAALTPATNIPASTVSTKTPMRAAPPRTGARSNYASALATQLEHDLSMSSGVTRWLYWLEAVEKATLSDFPELARLAQGNSTLMRLLAARWVERDPRHLFDTLVTASKDGRAQAWAELATVLFDEWPKRDPEAVVAALNGPDDFGLRSSWRKRVSVGLIEKDAERGLRLMADWHIENHEPRMTAVARWAVADPRHAAEFTLEHPAGYVSRSTMELIGKAWARTDPARALEFAAAKPGELGAVLAASVVKNWAGQNLDGAADWLAGTDARTRNRLSPALVETWAKRDAGSALAWCETNLTGSSLVQAVGGAIKSVANRDVISAAELVTAMNPSSARVEAALTVIQKWFPEFSSDKPVPGESIAWLSGLDAETVKRVLDQVAWRWAACDPKSMADFLASASREQISFQAYSILARNMARKNPVETLEWANLLPENYRLGAGSDAFNAWQRCQPESAMKWLSELPSFDARRQPFFQNAIRALVYEPQAAEQLAALAAADREAARNLIATMPLPEDRRTKLLEVLKPR